MKIAVLSNVNMNYVARLLKKDFDVCPSVGYGDIWGQMLQENSILNDFKPAAVIILIDGNQLFSGRYVLNSMKNSIDEFFSMLRNAINADVTYYVGDLWFRDSINFDNDEFLQEEIYWYWLLGLKTLMKELSNLHRLSGLFEDSGAKFDKKLWYMGKVPFSPQNSVIIAEQIKQVLRKTLCVVPKKLLVLDLDNTLWGGIIGDAGVEGIVLSDDHAGAVYKDVQIRIKEMKKRGVVLAICSKNNMTDVEAVWKEHPHMILAEDDFVSMKIDWTDKANNILEITKALNIGLDSVVFIDDMPAERENVRLQLPDVCVPDFPENLEDYPGFIDTVYMEYFFKASATTEDLNKTAQYQENTKRQETAKGMDYEDFVKSLKLKAERVAFCEGTKERIVQLINKTNQFNLTTKRYTLADLEKLITDGWGVYAYRVSDKFGDYGIVAVILIDKISRRIDSFVMSCRIMGKRIEYYFLEDVEKDLANNGVETIYAEYIPSAKNMPVRDFYSEAGYQIVSDKDGKTTYRIELDKRIKLEYFVNQGE